MWNLKFLMAHVTSNHAVIDTLYGKPLWCATMPRQICSMFTYFEGRTVA